MIKKLSDQKPDNADSGKLSFLIVGADIAGGITTAL